MIDEHHWELEHAFNPLKLEKKEGDKREAMTVERSYNYMFSAPEMLPPVNRIEDDRRYYGRKADIWMLGCIIFNMVTGIPPFYADGDKL